MLQRLLVLSLLFSSGLNFAQDEPQSGPQPQPRCFRTEHVLRTNDETLAYTAVAETLTLRNADGEPEAEFFTFSYTLEGDAAERPLTFVFNGGPGSASVWLHMGLVGPRLVDVPSDGQGAGAPPYPVIDNPDTLLDVTDLVFIDPIGTGFSRVVAEGEGEDHWGVDEDARSVARFVRRYLSEKERWASPKYLLGESYGGIRSALLVRELQSGFNAVALNGVILVSPALDMEVIEGQDNDAAFATVLPTFALTAWFHDALEEEFETLEDLQDEVRSFVDSTYVPALFRGRDLDEEQHEAVVADLARFTGLDADYIRRANLRVSSDRFRRELLRDRGLVVGRLDSRYSGVEADAVGELPSGDPLAAGISGAYVAAFHAHLAEHLEARMERDYVVMSSEAGAAWKRPGEEWPAFQGYLDVTPELARGMAHNPGLQLFIANGLYDLATTAFAAEYNLRRSTIDRSRVTMKDYPAGHMMYVHEPSRRALAADLREFYRQSSKRIEAQQEVGQTPF